MDADTDDYGNCLDAPGSAMLYYHQDANYNVIAVRDAAGAVLQRYLYDPYGQLHVYNAYDTASPDRGDLAADEILLPLVEVDTGVVVVNPFTYTGRFHDVETGLYDYRARHYPPSLGRFVQRDPAGYLDSTNLYQ